MNPAALEAILFAAARPVSFTTLERVTGFPLSEIKQASRELAEHFRERESGLCLVQTEKEVQLVTRPDLADLLRGFLRDETQGELTRPALETLAVIAYRGPLTKAELEQIRGVNCSLILRNLALRDLTQEETGKDGEIRYTLSIACLRFLGLSSLETLPDYVALREAVLAATSGLPDQESASL